jgi:hypothetical protein
VDKNGLFEQGKVENLVVLQLLVVALLVSGWRVQGKVFCHDVCEVVEDKLEFLGGVGKEGMIGVGGFGGLVLMDLLEEIFLHGVRDDTSLLDLPTM